MKNNDFDLSILQGGSLFGSAFGNLASSGWATAIITLAVAALVTFTEVGFVGGINQNITGTVIALLIASYLIYFSTEGAGESDGMKSEEYRQALSEYRSALSQIRPDDIYSLREFCHRYAQDELKFRREGELMKRGLSYQELESFISGEYRGDYARALRRIAKMKPRRLTPAMLLSREGGDGELIAPTGKRALALVIRLFPTTVCTFFTGAIVLGLKDNLTAQSIIEGIVKLSALPVIAVKGYSAGFAYARGELSAWLNTKAKLLLGFLGKRAAACTEENK